MNKQNVHALGDLIVSLPVEKFRMTNTLNGTHFVSPCGSPSCIAGWAAWLEQGKPDELRDNRKGWYRGENTLILSALRWIGARPIDTDVLDELFRGGHWFGANEKLTKRQAVATLRRYAETGEIYWLRSDV